MGEMTLRGYQRAVHEWIGTVGGKYFSPLSILAQMTEEVGEVARVVNRTYGDQTFKASDKDKDLADELAGVMFAITCMANSLELDLEGALDKHLAKITKRDAVRFEELKGAA